MIERTLQRWPWLALSLTTLLTAVGLWTVVGPLLLSPNQYVYSFGGDALVLYYNAVYHVVCGAPGQTLDAMLYPHGELIFLTDAQGSLVLMMQWVHRHLFDLSDSVIGILHTINHLGVIVAGPLVYLVAVRLGISRWMSLLFAPSIVLLSPQILRLGGHFGLAYPFLIPLTILWFLRKRTRPDYKDLLVAGVLLLFTFNNPYVGFSAGLTLLAAVALGLWRPAQRRSLLITGAGMLAVLGFVFVYFKIFDPFDDRIQLQWGALTYRTRLLGGSFTPDGSLLRRWFAAKSTAEWEAYQYLGVVPLISIVLWLVLRLGNEYHKHRLSLKQVPPLVWAYLAGATAVYLFVYDWGFSVETGVWLESKASFVLMFKAIARLAWPFYFAIALLGLCALTQVFNLFSWRRPVFATVLTLAVAVLYAYDVQVYHKKRFPELFDNLFRSERVDANRRALAEMGVSPGDYQALLLVPRLLSWNDNMMVDWDWSMHLTGVNTSVALGLAMINANHSRASVGKLHEVTQVMSRPGIDRQAILSQLPDARPILLIRSNQERVYTPGELYLLKLADSLGASDLATFYRLDPARLRGAEQAQRRSNCALLASATAPLLHFNYDAEPSGQTYASGGAHRLSPGREELLTYVAPDSAQTVVASAWIRSTTKRYGLGFLQAQVLDSSGNLVHERQSEVRRLGDTDGLWFYYQESFALAAGQQLQLWINAEAGSTYLDEVMLRREGVNTVARSGEDVLLNGIKVICGG